MRIHRQPGVLPIVSQLLAVLSVIFPCHGQDITGRWVARGKAMENGETQKLILDLTQTGDTLAGRLTSFGGRVDVHGKVAGTHFELIGVGWADRKPFLAGDLVNGELRGYRWPATAADSFPAVPYIEPPALHNMPHNGLAKTPPMGWNS